MGAIKTSARAAVLPLDRGAGATRSQPRHLPGVAAALLAGAGLWVSFAYARVAWGPDPDIFVTVALWRGFQAHGLGFFSSWLYSQDNWLFSLAPVASTAFALFGVHAWVALGLGWGFFLASTALAALLAARLAGAATGMILAAVLSFASFTAIGPAGFLGYPISHNVSMTWGLATVALGAAGLTRRSPVLCVLAAFTVFLNAVSDPWAGAAIALPVILASAALGLSRAPDRRCARVLAVSCLLAFAAARTRAFGLLWFLPPSHVEFAGLAGMLGNLRWGVRAITGLCNVVPGGNVDNPLVQAVDLLALALILGWAAASAASRLRHAGVERRFVEAVALLSIAAVGAIFVIGRWDAPISAGRFFPNLYFLGAVLVAVEAAAHWPKWRRLPRAAVVVYAGLFVLSGLASRPAAWLDREPPRNSDQVRALGLYLAGQGLTYGYGPFWGAQALAMDTLTEGAVTVRPVTFRHSRIRRRPAETSSYWFRPSAEPAGRPLFLLIRNDGEECPDPVWCEQLAVRQFGAPARRLTYGDAVILVWNGGLAAKIAG